MTQEALLIGKDIDDAFGALNSSLRSATLLQANAALDVKRDRYTPWLGCAEKLANADPYLLDFVPHDRGGLIRDERYIKAAADFLENHAPEACAALGGDIKEWMPTLENPSRQFDDARNLVLGSGLAMSALWHATVDCVIPLGGKTRRGFSAHHIRGAIFRSFPQSFTAGSCAIDLIHELGHTVLAVWQSGDPILATDLNAPVYSEIRCTNRPAIQSFHAAVALAYMLHLQQAHPDNKEVQEAAHRKGRECRATLHVSLAAGLDELRKHCEFTEIGEQMMAEMDALLEAPDLSEAA